MMIIGYSLITLGINFEKKVTPIYKYTIQKTSDYEVILKPNNFYATQTLPSGKYYAAKSIDLFKINFIYDFKADKKEELEYNYNIDADLVGIVKDNDNQEKEVWTKNFMLKEIKDIEKINSDKFSINKDINVDYEEFNNLAREYEETYKIAIEAKLKVRLNIYLNINLSEFNIDNAQIQDFIELEIPLTNTTTEVTENYNKEEEKNILPSSEIIKNNKIILYSIGGIFILIAITIAIITIRRNIRNKLPQEIYEYNINHILKYYKELIVTIKNKPDLENLKIMNLETFEDLIDLAEQTKSNIIHYEIIKNKESNFYVIINEYVYIYQIKQN